MEVKIYTKDKIIHFFNPLHIIIYTLLWIFYSYRVHFLDLRTFKFSISVQKSFKILIKAST